MSANQPNTAVLDRTKNESPVIETGLKPTPESREKIQAQELYKLLDTDLMSTLALGSVELAWTSAGMRIEKEKYEETKNAKKQELTQKIGRIKLRETFKNIELLKSVNLENTDPAILVNEFANIKGESADLGLEKYLGIKNRSKHTSEDLLNRILTKLGNEYIDSTKLNARVLLNPKSDIEKYRAELMSLNSELVDLFRGSIDGVAKPSLGKTVSGFTQNAGNWGSRFLQRFGGDWVWESNLVKNATNFAGVATVTQQREVYQGYFEKHTSEKFSNYSDDQINKTASNYISSIALKIAKFAKNNGPLLIGENAGLIAGLSQISGLNIASDQLLGEMKKFAQHGKIENCPQLLAISTRMGEKLKSQRNKIKNIVASATVWSESQQPENNQPQFDKKDVESSIRSEEIMFRGNTGITKGDQRSSGTSFAEGARSLSSKIATQTIQIGSFIANPLAQALLAIPVYGPVLARVANPLTLFSSATMYADTQLSPDNLVTFLRDKGLNDLQIFDVLRASKEQTAQKYDQSLKPVSKEILDVLSAKNIDVKSLIENGNLSPLNIHKELQKCTTYAEISHIIAYIASFLYTGEAIRTGAAVVGDAEAYLRAEKGLKITPTPEQTSQIRLNNAQSLELLAEFRSAQLNKAIDFKAIESQVKIYSSQTGTGAITSAGIAAALGVANLAITGKGIDIENVIERGQAIKDLVSLNFASLSAISGVKPGEIVVNGKKFNAIYHGTDGVNVQAMIPAHGLLGDIKGGDKLTVQIGEQTYNVQVDIADKSKDSVAITILNGAQDPNLTQLVGFNANRLMAAKLTNGAEAQTRLGNSEVKSKIVGQFTENDKIKSVVIGINPSDLPKGYKLEIVKEGIKTYPIIKNEQGVTVFGPGISGKESNIAVGGVGFGIQAQGGRVITDANGNIRVELAYGNAKNIGDSFKLFNGGGDDDEPTIATTAEQSEPYKAPESTDTSRSSSNSETSTRVEYTEQTQPTSRSAKSQSLETQVDRQTNSKTGRIDARVADTDKEVPIDEIKPVTKNIPKVRQPEPVVIASTDIIEKDTPEMVPADEADKPVVNTAKTNSVITPETLENQVERQTNSKTGIIDASETDTKDVKPVETPNIKTNTTNSAWNESSNPTKLPANAQASVRGVYGAELNSSAGQKAWVESLKTPQQIQQAIENTKMVDKTTTSPDLKEQNRLLIATLESKSKTLQSQSTLIANLKSQPQVAQKPAQTILPTEQTPQITASNIEQVGSRTSPEIQNAFERVSRLKQSHETLSDVKILLNNVSNEINNFTGDKNSNKYTDLIKVQQTYVDAIKKADVVGDLGGSTKIPVDFAIETVSGIINGKIKFDPNNVNHLLLVDSDELTNSQKANLTPKEKTFYDFIDSVRSKLGREREVLEIRRRYGDNSPEAAAAIKKYYNQVDLSKNSTTNPETQKPTQTILPNGVPAPLTPEEVARITAQSPKPEMTLAEKLKNKQQPIFNGVGGEINPTDIQNGTFSTINLSQTGQTTISVPTTLTSSEVNKIAYQAATLANISQTSTFPNGNNLGDGAFSTVNLSQTGQISQILTSPQANQNGTVPWILGQGGRTNTGGNANESFPTTLGGKPLITFTLANSAEKRPLLTPVSSNDVTLIKLPLQTDNSNLSIQVQGQPYELVSADAGNGKVTFYAKDENGNLFRPNLDNKTLQEAVQNAPVTGTNLKVSELFNPNGIDPKELQGNQTPVEVKPYLDAGLSKLTESDKVRLQNIVTPEGRNIIMNREVPEVVQRLVTGLSIPDEILNKELYSQTGGGLTPTEKYLWDILVDKPDSAEAKQIRDAIYVLRQIESKTGPISTKNIQNSDKLGVNDKFVFSSINSLSSKLDKEGRMTNESLTAGDSVRLTVNENRAAIQSVGMLGAIKGGAYFLNPETNPLGKSHLVTETKEINGQIITLPRAFFRGDFDKEKLALIQKEYIKFKNGESVLSLDSRQLLQARTFLEKNGINGMSDSDIETAAFTTAMADNLGLGIEKFEGYALHSLVPSEARNSGLLKAYRSEFNAANPEGTLSPDQIEKSSRTDIGFTLGQRPISLLSAGIALLNPIQAVPGVEFKTTEIDNSTVGNKNFGKDFVLIDASKVDLGHSATPTGVEQILIQQAFLGNKLPFNIGIGGSSEASQSNQVRMGTVEITGVNSDINQLTTFIGEIDQKFGSQIFRNDATNEMSAIVLQQIATAELAKKLSNGEITSVQYNLQVRLLQQHAPDMILALQKRHTIGRNNDAGAGYLGPIVELGDARGRNIDINKDVKTVVNGKEVLFSELQQLEGRTGVETARNQLIKLDFANEPEAVRSKLAELLLYAASKGPKLSNAQLAELNKKMPAGYIIDRNSLANAGYTEVTLKDGTKAYATMTVMANGKTTGRIITDLNASAFTLKKVDPDIPVSEALKKAEILARLRDTNTCPSNRDGIFRYSEEAAQAEADFDCVRLGICTEGQLERLQERFLVSKVGQQAQTAIVDTTSHNDFTGVAQQAAGDHEKVEKANLLTVKSLNDSIYELRRHPENLTAIATNLEQRDLKVDPEALKMMANRTGKSGMLMDLRVQLQEINQTYKNKLGVSFNPFAMIFGANGGNEQDIKTKVGGSLNITSLTFLTDETGKFKLDANGDKIPCFEMTTNAVSNSAYYHKQEWSFAFKINPEQPKPETPKEQPKTDTPPPRSKIGDTTPGGNAPKGPGELNAQPNTVVPNNGIPNTTPGGTTPLGPGVGLDTNFKTILPNNQIPQVTIPSNAPTNFTGINTFNQNVVNTSGVAQTVQPFTAPVFTPTVPTFSVPDASGVVNQSILGGTGPLVR